MVQSDHAGGCVDWECWRFDGDSSCLDCGRFFAGAAYGGGYYPAFAISAVLLGILVHCFFYQRELQLRRLKDWGTVLFAMLSVNLLWGILLNSYWLSLMYGMSYFSVVLSRLPLLLTAVIQSVLIMLILPRFRKIGQIRRLSGWVEK